MGQDRLNNSGRANYSTHARTLLTGHLSGDASLSHYVSPPSRGHNKDNTLPGILRGTFLTVLDLLVANSAADDANAC